MHSVAASALYTLALGAPPAAAQCLDWAPGFDARGAVSEVQALAVYDDGDGAKLCAAASFGFGLPDSARKIRAWDGVEWSVLAPATDQSVYALAAFDDGGGGALYAGGAFTTAGTTSASLIARWNGDAWSPLGSGLSNPSFPADGRVHALVVHDDGTGRALFAGGVFTASGVMSVRRVARWNGSTWSALGNGMNGAVRTLAVYDDGSGAALYAGGSFTSASGIAASNVARWNGTAWSALGSGVDGEVLALTVHDDGTGAALYAGGTFAHAGGASTGSIAKWNGANWSALASGVDGAVRALASHDDGGGTALYALGDFAHAGGTSAQRAARWRGSTWLALETGLDARASAWCAFDDGSGAALYAGGAFARAGDAVASRVARWSSGGWSAVGTGRGMNDGVFAFTPFDARDGAGEELVAGGVFTVAGDAAAARIASFDGERWRELGGGVDAGVTALAVFDDGSGSGTALFVGGNFTHAGGVDASRIAKWDGASWSALGLGVDNLVRALAVHDDGAGGGPALYAAGAFGEADDQPAILIAKWDGASWSPLGAGLGMPHFNSAFALASFKSASSHGAELVAAGSFLSAGGSPAQRIASWDGVHWSPLGAGINGLVRALCVYEDGSGDGPALYAGGTFTLAGTSPCNNVARWNGVEWSAVGSGVDGAVSTLAPFDDGRRAALYAGGSFALPGTSEMIDVARWVRGAWRPLDGGPNGPVAAMAAYHDGSPTGPDLYLGGNFDAAGAVRSDNVAAWRGCGVRAGGARVGSGARGRAPAPIVPTCAPARGPN